MAYDRNKNERQSDNPYDDVVGGARAFARGDAPQASFAQPLEGGNAGPTASGHVNFDQIFNANLDTSKREAGKIQHAAEEKGKAVQSGTSKLQQDFATATRTGALGGPNGAQQLWASGAKTGVIQPKKVVSSYIASDAAKAAPLPTPKGSDTKQVGGYEIYVGNPFDKQNERPEGGPQSGETVRNEGLDSGDFLYKDRDGNTRRASYDADGNMVEGPVLSPEEVAAWQAQFLAGKEQGGAPSGPTPDEIRRQVEAGAAQEYGGPGSLSDLDPYDQLLRDAIAAQDEAQSLGQGNAGLEARGLNQLDAALLGGAGRRGFEDIARNYGGVKSTLQQANAASKGIADAERTRREQDAEAYQALLDEYEGRVSTDQAKADARAKKNEAVSDKAKKRAADEDTYNKAMTLSPGEEARNFLHKAATNLSPVDFALQETGNKTIVGAGTQYLGEGVGGDQPDGYNAGNKSQAWGNDDADVFASMSAADWTEFNSLSLKAQREWIAARKAKLRGGG